MDYLMDQYLPAALSPDAKKYIKDRAFGVLIWADWFCGARDIRDFVSTQPSLLACEFIYLLSSLLTLIHAYRNGARYVYFWIATFIFGLSAEYSVHHLLEKSLFWHAQTTLTFFGRHTPLYIILGFYPSVLYTACVSAKKLFLSPCAEAAAAGVLALLMSCPFSILSTTLLWISWHDTHPDVEERFYHTPYTMYMFITAAGSSLCFLTYVFRRILLPAEYDWKLFVREFFCVASAGILAFWLAVGQMLLFYSLPHDLANVPSSLCFFTFIGLYCYYAWSVDRRPLRIGRPHSFYNRYWFDEMCVVIVVQLLFFAGLILVSDPANIVSTGLHEPIGPCESYVTVENLLGMESGKSRQYLCPTRYDEPYFDLHCRGTLTPKMRDGEPVQWYTICGTAFANLAEHAFLLWSVCLFVLLVFFQCLARSGECPTVPVVKRHDNDGRANGQRKRKSE